MVTQWEWILILIVVGALIIWGPKKIPELARAIGQARGEFERTSKEAAKPIYDRKEKEEELSSENALIETASKLGMSTQGKTKEQISKEIVEKFKAQKEAST